MATVNEITSLFGRIAPEKNKCDFDNVGLIVGRGDKQVSKVLVCLDVTGDVLDEAIKYGVQLIISHHPMIFGGIKSVTDEQFAAARVAVPLKITSSMMAS